MLQKLQKLSLPSLLTPPISKKSPTLMDFKSNVLSSPTTVYVTAIPYAATAKKFQPNFEFHVAVAKRVPLNPPLSTSTEAMDGNIASTDNVEIDEAFLNALEVLHHNPCISFDAEMTDEVLEEIKNLNSKGTDIDPSKRRKRVWADAANPSHNQN